MSEQGGRSSGRTDEDPFLWKRGANPIKYRLLDAWVAGTRVLDIGCGPGYYSQHLAERGLAVTALDQDPPANGNTQIAWVRASVPPLPFEDKAFDTTVLFDVLEHVPDECALLDEIRRVTSRRLILSVPSDDDQWLPQYGLCLVHHVDKSHLREYSAAGIRRVLSRNGFSVASVVPHEASSVAYTIVECVRDTAAGTLARKLTRAWIKALRILRLLREPIPADWFVIADVLPDPPDRGGLTSDDGASR